MEYFDLKITVEHQNEQKYRISIDSSAGGNSEDTVEFPYADDVLNAKLKGISNALRTTGARLMGRRHDDEASRKVTPDDIKAFGQALFGFLFSGPNGNHLDRVQSKARGEVKQTGVRLQLRFNENSARLAAIPWEFLRHSEEHKDYISLDKRLSLVRYINLGQGVEPLLGQRPLKILGMISNPLGDLKVEKEKKWVEDSLKELISAGLVELAWVEGDSTRDLQSAIRNGDWQVFHYIGHGGFDIDRDEGFLLLGDGKGGTFNLTATSLGRFLKAEKFKLVLLNACEGAVAASDNLFSSTASTLIGDGILAVLAMQYPISDSVAIELARTFYSAVADGVSVDYALADARVMIRTHFEDSAEWATPVLFMRSSKSRLLEKPDEESDPVPPKPEPIEEPDPVPPKPEPKKDDGIPDGYDPNDVKIIGRRALKKVVENFTVEELKDMADDLGVDHENLPSSTRSGIARELIGHLKRRNQLDELINWLNDEGKRQIDAVTGHRGPINYED